MIEDVWYLARDGVQRGPFTWAQLSAARDRLEILPSDFVWNAKFEGWIPATAVFTPSPPPPPPRQTRGATQSPVAMATARHAANAFATAAFSPTKLPVRATAGRAYRTVREFYGRFLALTLVCAAAMATLAGTFAWLTWPIMRRLPEQALQGLDARDWFALQGFGALNFALMAVPVTILATNWTTAVLTGSPSPSWRWNTSYYGRLLALYALSTASSIPQQYYPLVRLQQGMDRTDVLTPILVIAAQLLPLVFAFAALRLALALPSTVDHRPITFGEAWRLGKGNTLRLLGGVLLCVAIPFLIVMLAMAAVGPMAPLQSQNFYGVWSGTMSFLNGFFFPLTIAFYAAAYQHLGGMAQSSHSPRAW